MTLPDVPATPAPDAPAQTPPPWGDDANFDPAKAWQTIQHLRGREKELEGRPVLDDAAKAKLAEYDKLVEAQKTAEQRSAEEATRWQTEAEKWRGTAVASKVQALAATDFADPDDAVRSLDSAKYLGVDGVIDESAIESDLAALLDAKPHYRRPADAAAPRRAPAPNPHQGSGGGRAAPDPATEFAAAIQTALQRG